MAEKQSASDVQSTASSTAESETETIINCNEPWVTFKPKVEQLCMQLWPAAKAIDVARIEGGASNRIVAVTVTAQDHSLEEKVLLPTRVRRLSRRLFGFRESKRSTTKIEGEISLPAGEFILRIPRLLDDEEGPLIQYDTATTAFAGKLIDVPVPSVLHQEMTRDNPIDSWYVVQNKLRGRPLDEVWDDLNHHQRLDIARQIGKVVKDICANTFLAGGRVDARDPSRILAFTTPGLATNRVEIAKDAVHPVEFIKDRLQEWAKQPHSEWRPYRALAALITRESIGSEPDYYFVHSDLYPRNILVDIDNEDHVRVTGILDWDNAQFAPAFVAHEPPCWLWKHEDLKSGFLEGPNLRKNAAERLQDPLEQEIKEAFEAVVGEAWLKIAYRQDVEIYRWIWQIMIEGLWYDTILWVAEDAVEELTGEPYEFKSRRPSDRSLDGDMIEETEDLGSESDDKDNAKMQTSQAVEDREKSL